MPKIKTYPQLKKDLDSAFSRYIRLRDNNICFTCGKKMEISSSQAGHFVSRNHLSTRWDEKNVHCQCYGCNVARKGNMAVYALRMIDKYGVDILYELEAKKKQTLKLPHDWMREQIEYYKFRAKSYE